MIPRVLEPEVMDSAEEARDYDAMDHAEVNARFIEDFEAFAGKHARRVLDVGTGTARIPVLLCTRLAGATVTGTDLSDEMLAVARANVDRAGLGARIALVTEDAKTMRFADGAFDAVVSNTIVHHIPDPEPALREMWRVVGAGGVLFVRDLARPASDAEVAALVAQYGGAPASAAPADVASHARQKALFEASLRAALTVPEIAEILARLGLPKSAVRMTSDRHWTIAQGRAR
jgi:ubiquinone/menaquinone biosynthesis C-methylase UbiE